MRISDWSLDVCSSDLGGVHNVARSYLELLRHRHFMAYALAGGLGSSMMFSYISVSAFVFIDVYHFTPVQFSWLLGCNAAALIVAAQLNARVLRTARKSTRLNSSH